MKSALARTGYWLPPLAWAAGIFALSSISFPPRAPTLPLQDKIAHAVLFAVLSLLLYRALRGERGCSPARAAAWAFALTILYGATDEFHQWFTPQRTVDLRDWLADLLGAAVVFLLLLRSAGPVSPRLHLRSERQEGT